MEISAYEFALDTKSQAFLFYDIMVYVEIS
jgi:hypothetical protein